MKKAMLALIGIAMILSLAGCSKPTDTQSQQTPDSDLSSDLQETSEAGTTIHSDETYSADTNESIHEDDNTSVAQGYYDSIFEDVIDENPETSGPPITYDEVMDIITDPQYGGLDSFYLVEAVELMTLPECETLQGFDDWFYDMNGVKYDEIKSEGVDYFGNNLIYKVKLIKNLISGEDCGYEIYTDLYMNGPVYQTAGDPPYAPGEQFTLALFNKSVNSDIVRSGAGYVFRLDVRNVDNLSVAYAREKSGFTILNFNGTDKIQEKIVTSTTQNPVLYTSKTPLSEISDFLKNDWHNREVGRNE